jgi:hypothetical protein
LPLFKSRKTPDPFSPSKGRAKADYFFSSFLSSFLLQVSQVLPALAASTQHLWEHSLPAALAFSQQLSARATLTLPKNATAQTMATNVLTDFMFFLYLSRNALPGSMFLFCILELGSDSAPRSDALPVDYTEFGQIDNNHLISPSLAQSTALVLKRQLTALFRPAYKAPCR